MSRSVPAPVATKVCLHCGTHVSRDWRRTFGDDQLRAHRCPNCDSKRRIQSGSAAGKDVAIPDPEDHPSRQRGESA